MEGRGLIGLSPGSPGSPCRLDNAVNSSERFAIDAARINIYISAGFSAQPHYIYLLLYFYSVAVAVVVVIIVFPRLGV